MERMRALIEGKNFAALRDMLAPFRENPASAALLRLSRLFGGPEVLDEAEALAGETEAVEYLRALYGELSAAGYGALVRFDLGMVHQIDYYTGVVFRGYVEGAGDAVLSGGRYDSLVGVFGREAQATGFAVDVDAMAAPARAAHPRWTLWSTTPPATWPRRWRRWTAGRRGPCELSPCRTLESSCSLAREKGAKTVLVFDVTGERVVKV